MKGETKKMLERLLEVVGNIEGTRDILVYFQNTLEAERKGDMFALMLTHRNIPFQALGPGKVIRVNGVRVTFVSVQTPERGEGFDPRVTKIMVDHGVFAWAGGMEYTLGMVRDDPHRIDEWYKRTVCRFEVL
jgi:hypothetical protein